MRVREEEDDLDDYISAHISPEPEYLKRLELESHLVVPHAHMCSGHLQGRLLKMLTEMIRPSRVLELGTFTAYSTICIAEGLPEDGRIDTIENYRENEELIRHNIKGSGYADKIDLHIADGEAFMAGVASDSYDMIFIDADKRRYPQYLHEGLRILKPGGYILADNTLWDGHVADPERQDALTEGVREFNRMVALDDRLEKVILPFRDGLSLIRLSRSEGQIKGD